MNNTAWLKTSTQNQTQLPSWLLPEFDSSWYSLPASLPVIAGGFSPISLLEMDSAALLDRTDTKFMLSNNQLLDVMSTLQHDYQILSVCGQRLNHYRTLYFDTPDFQLYNLHVNGRADCYKVRSREYTDSCQSFLEVKHKTPKGRTVKDRIPTALPMRSIDPEAIDWLHEVFPYDGRALEPKLWNTFTRITLVNVHRCERVTLDVNLTFNTSEKVKFLNGLVIAEVKMDSKIQASPFLLQMHDRKIHPRGFSKYCIGVSLLYSQVKKNSLKPKILWLSKMTGGTL